MLSAAGLEFDVVSPNVDEAMVLDSLAASGASARDASDALAELKAVKVSSRHPEAWVIGCDQILSLQGEFFCKPGTLQALRTQLLQLRGKTHTLTSAVCVARGGSVVWRHIEEARLKVRAFSEAFLERYIVDAGVEILHSVGGYHVEGRGVQLFDSIEGDSFTIMGLPLVPLLAYLRLHQVLET